MGDTCAGCMDGWDSLHQESSKFRNREKEEDFQMPCTFCSILFGFDSEFGSGFWVSGFGCEFDFMHPILLLLLLLLLGAAPCTHVSAQGGDGEFSISPADAPALGIANESLVLAEGRTARRDPLNNFYTYRDGWDIRNQHYWASVGYTAWPGFILALVWLLVGVGYVFLLCICCCCCPQKLHGKHRGGNLFPCLFLLVFTSAVITGCVLVYVGQDRAHRELSKTLNFVVNESDVVVQKLSNVSSSLSVASNLMVVRFSLPQSEQDQIQALEAQIHTAAITLQNKTAENSEIISRELDRVRFSMVVIVGVMMSLVVVGFVCAAIGFLPLMYLLVFAGWFLVAGTWILCGIYIMLNNVVGDTCVSMKEWVHHPSASTNLDDILPCVDTATTNQTLLETQDTINNTVANINNAVTSVINAGSAGGMPLICNPVYPEISSASCIDINNVSQVWAAFVCNSSNTSSCPVNGRLTPDLYGQLVTATKVISTLNSEAPFLLNLRNCVFVREVFVKIRKDHCHPLRTYLEWQYIGLALISGGLMFAIVLWIVFSRRRKHRFFHRNTESQFLMTDTASMK